MAFGYDEISETHIYMTYCGQEGNGYAEIYRGRKIVSVQRMKAVFCDECIWKIMDAIEESSMDEVVLFDAKKKRFYPIEDGTVVQIGNYEMMTSRCYGGYIIDVKNMTE